YHGLDGARAYWGNADGTALWESLGRVVPELRGQVAADPTIAPWVNRPEFAQAVHELRSEGRLTPDQLSQRLGERLGCTGVYRGLRLSPEALAELQGNGLQAGAIRNGGSSTEETFQGMISYRLGGDQTTGAVPEKSSLFGSVTGYNDVANAVASQTPGS